ncbi:BTAD domain-containing putative transcriptional regulator [Lentzea sp. NPDC042327]|uniref:BTAD domain-containing putative transcriptional regulator n=1 Tax=Lentzea sp. NPDC042327 TaxID=3154801 RepID=UPI0033D5C26D
MTRVDVLGPLVVRGDGPVEVRGKRLRWLLIRLAMQPGRVVTAEQLIADLWPDEPPADGAAALQSLVSRLRRAVGASVISSHAGGYRLEADTDVEEFLRTRDAALWRGAPFEDAPFAVDEAVRLALLRDDLTGLEALAAAHPLREDVQARLMLALHAAGRRSDALAVHERVRAALAEELGVDPGEALAAAHLAVLRDRGVRGNLPAPVGSFVGRGEDLDALGGLLAANRLVTLTGFGGVGKTRLALAHASSCASAWFVELDSAADPLAALDAALGPNPLAMPVFDRLGTSLVVLDNCEHVVDAAASLCARLLAEAPGVRVLATSREPLGIPGEVVHPVAPLDLDHSVRLFSARVGAALDQAVVRRVCVALEGIPLALELAAARARSLSARQLEARVGSRLRLLDRGTRTGPVRHRTLRAVVDWSWELLDPDERELLARVAVFVGGATAAAVHEVCSAEGDLWATEDLLSALVEKSLVVRSGERYRLLETVREYALEQGLADQAAHARHYVELAERTEPLFRGPRQLEALEVFDAERANLDAALAWAVGHDQGLARRMVAARTWHWLVMTKRFEEIRRWAPLVPGDPLSEVLAALGTPEAALAAERLWQQDVPTALCALMLTSGQVWGQAELGGRMSALADRLERSGDEWMRAFSALVRGVVAGEFSEGAAPEAERAYREALRLFRAVGDRWAVVFGLSCLVMVLINRGAHAEGFRAVSEARRVAAELGDPESVLVPMSVLVQTARLKVRIGDLAGAREDLAQVHPVHDLDRGRVAQAHGEVAFFGGDFEEAVRLYRRALAVTGDAHAVQFRATVHAGLGLALTRLGHLDQAGEHYARALDTVSGSADGPARASVLETYAGWLLAQGDARSAADALTEAERLRGGPSSDPAVVQLRDRVRAEVRVDR